MTEKAPVGLIDARNINSCGLEGIQGRPADCNNNPWKYPDNHRPKICQKCPGDPGISRIAERKLPDIYIKFKQQV